jgi:hypothetical protein
MSCHNIDFIEFDLAFKLDHGLRVHYSFAKLINHILDIITIEIQFVGDLEARKV